MTWLAERELGTLQFSTIFERTLCADPAHSGLGRGIQKTSTTSSSPTNGLPRSHVTWLSIGGERGEPPLRPRQTRTEDQRKPTDRAIKTLGFVKRYTTEGEWSREMLLAAMDIVTGGDSAPAPGLLVPFTTTTPKQFDAVQAVIQVLYIKFLSSPAVTELRNDIADVCYPSRRRRSSTDCTPRRSRNGFQRAIARTTWRQSSRKLGLSLRRRWSMWASCEGLAATVEL